MHFTRLPDYNELLTIIASTSKKNRETRKKIRNVNLKMYLLEAAPNPNHVNSQAGPWIEFCLGI